MEQIHSRPMTGRTVLVTGSTSGIGKATAQGLARMGTHLAITGRDPEATEGAAREIRAAGGGQVDAFVADLSSQSEVRRLAREVLQSRPRIDVLVNNVGGYWNTRHVTADGLEHTFVLHHLAPFLLTNLLLERLKESAPTRVVTVVFLLLGCRDRRTATSREHEVRLDHRAFRLRGSGPSNTGARPSRLRIWRK